MYGGNWCVCMCNSGRPCLNPITPGPLPLVCVSKHTHTHTQTHTHTRTRPETDPATCLHANRPWSKVTHQGPATFRHTPHRSTCTDRVSCVRAHLLLFIHSTYKTHLLVVIPASEHTCCFSAVATSTPAMPL